MKIKAVQIGSNFFAPDFSFEDNNGKTVSNKDLPSGEQVRIFYRLLTLGQQRRFFHSSHIQNKRKPEKTETELDIDLEGLVLACVEKVENIEVSDGDKVKVIKTGQDLIDNHAKSPVLMAITREFTNMIISSTFQTNTGDAEDFLE